MTAIRWTEAMSVDNPALDKDHQRLIRMINDLNQEAPAFPELFNAVLEYVDGHFDREEAHLEAIGFPGLDAHRAQHDSFADQVAAMLRQYRDRPFQPGDTALKDFLWTWLKGHILIEDQRYAAWTRAKGA
jgi:hemerythrin